MGETKQEPIMEELTQSVIQYDVERAEKLALEVIERDLDLIQAIGSLTQGIKEVGDGFGKGDLFLPELIIAADAMQAALKEIDPIMIKKGQKRKTEGLLLIGTVAGDVHDIGKNIVGAIFRSHGYEVIDLGVDVEDEVFIEKCREVKPDILGLSALLTSTMVRQRSIIARLKEEGLRDSLKVFVGGAVGSDEWAQEIGADCYAPDAVIAVKKAKSLE